MRKAGTTTWVKARTDRTQTGNTVTKQVTVENNPFQNLRVQPWAETATVSGNGGGTVQDDHVNFVYTSQQSASAQIMLDYSSLIQDLTLFDGSLVAQGLVTKARNMTACAVPGNAAARTYEPCIFQGGVWTSV